MPHGPVPRSLVKHSVSIYYNPSLFPPSLESPYLTAVNVPESWGVQTQFNGLQAGFAVLKIREIKYFIETESIGCGSRGRERKHYQPLLMGIFVRVFAWLCF